jgi:hypothetical protein
MLSLPEVAAWARGTSTSRSWTHSQNLPIVASVSYDNQTARLTVGLRSLPDPSGIRTAMARRWSPKVHDYADLEQYVRDRVSDFIALMEPAAAETRRDENRNRQSGICSEFSGPSPYPDEG